jgi:TonB family protein
MSADGANIVITKMHWMDPGPVAGTRGGFANKQNIRLLIALSLLLVLLVAVLVKDREFWFGSDQTVEADAVASHPVAMAATKAVAPATVSPTAVAPNKITALPANRPAAKNAVKNHVAVEENATPVAAPPVVAASSDAPAVSTSRVPLPPMDVEVVAGDKHNTVHPANNQISVTTEGQPVSAAERQRLSAVAVPELRRTIDTIYPTLGDKSKVQGSVILQAIVGADGNIENLNVVSGPAILASAAQQAVRQWHFKPVLQNGQPVETKARITVNFTIRVSDNAASAS